jgi:hypothetical protein
VSVTSDLEAVLASTEPLTEDECNRSLRIIARRAWEASQEHRKMTRTLTEAFADSEKAYWSALAESQANHPDRRVGHHEAVAKQAALDKAAHAKGCELLERSLRKEMEVLGSLVSALQSQLKNHRENG